MTLWPGVRGFGQDGCHGRSGITTKRQQEGELCADEVANIVAQCVHALPVTPASHQGAGFDSGQYTS